MLPASARLRTAADFRSTTRHGVRSGRATVVVHLRAVDNPPDVVPCDTRVGFVVSKAVGGAVVRNRVKRRLRHLVRPLLVDRPTGLAAVVRALPGAADATPETLDRDLTGAWRSCLGKLGA